MAAYARSALWGLRPPLFQPAPVRLGQAAPAVHRQLACALGHLNEDLVAGQRFGLTLLIRDLLVRELRAPLVYTLGYVYQDGQRLYHTPIEGLDQMPGRSYHPQWTSEEFVKRIGVVKEYEGW